MSAKSLKPGDWVIYSMSKRSRHPGPRARSIHPAQLGDDYSYVVDKFWVVSEVLNGQHVILRTRRGKTHTVSLDDPLLRKARWWERWRYRDRFPDPTAASSAADDVAQSRDLADPSRSSG